MTFNEIYFFKDTEQTIISTTLLSLKKLSVWTDIIVG